MFIEVKAEAYIYIRLNSTDSSAMTASDGILYRMSGLTCLPVCILDMFLAPNLTARLDDIPRTISLPKVQYNPRAPSSANFTGRKGDLTKLRTYFSAESDGPLRRKSFLLYGMGGIGKTQICLRFVEENPDL
jgi:hypothetical protein